MAGPSGYLEVDNVLEAVPEWCPGREPIESEKPVEEKARPRVQSDERTCYYCHGIGRCISVLYAPTWTRLSFEEFMNHTVVCSNCGGTGKVSVIKEPIENPEGCHGRDENSKPIDPPERKCDSGKIWIGVSSGSTGITIVNVPKVKITDKEALESIDPVDAARWLEHHG
jgi:hypothetical protein